MVLRENHLVEVLQIIGKHPPTPRSLTQPELNATRSEPLDNYRQLAVEPEMVPSESLSQKMLGKCWLESVLRGNVIVRMHVSGYFKESYVYRMLMLRVVAIVACILVQDASLLDTQTSLLVLD